MKRAFISTAGGHLASALVSDDTKSALSLGDRITITRDIDLGYAAQLRAGESGTVDHIDVSSGLIEILWDTPHRGLSLWENHIWLEPFGTEDIIDGFICN